MILLAALGLCVWCDVRFGAFDVVLGLRAGVFGYFWFRSVNFLGLDAAIALGLIGLLLDCAAWFGLLFCGSSLGFSCCFSFGLAIRFGDFGGSLACGVFGCSGFRCGLGFSVLGLVVGAVFAVI